MLPVIREEGGLVAMLLTKNSNRIMTNMCTLCLHRSSKSRVTSSIWHWEVSSHHYF